MKKKRVDPITLRHARELSGYSTRYVSEQLDVTTQTIYNHENGKTEPKASEIEAYAKVYDQAIGTIVRLAAKARRGK